MPDGRTIAKIVTKIIHVDYDIKFKLALLLCYPKPDRFVHCESIILQRMRNKREQMTNASYTIFVENFQTYVAML